jgi:hypothetical protein
MNRKRVFRMERFAGVALLVVSFGLGLPATLPAAVAQPAGWTEQDARFLRLVLCDTDSRDGCFLDVTDPGLLRNQALRLCRLEDEGMTGGNAVRTLMIDGPYSSDQAIIIVAAAHVVYCPQHLGR